MSGNAGARTYELLRQQAKKTGADVQALATSYAIERFMARLMDVDTNGNITVKGGQSLGILFGNQMRPTKDLDINIGNDGIDDPESWALDKIMAACASERDDGLSIDIEGVVAEHREHQGEGGLRVTVPASIHTCRTTFMIDVGIGNEITFEPSRVKVSGVLGGHRAAPPALDARVYPHENTIAEKLVAKIEDGLASIRHKDFFDVWLCIEILKRVGDLKLLSLRDDELAPEEAHLVSTVRASLSEGTLLSLPVIEPDEACLSRLGLALARTSAHRGTELPTNLAEWFLEEFGDDERHSAQWANWCRNQKGRLRFTPPGVDGDKADALKVLLEELRPALDSIEERALPHLAAAPSV